ncbi:hypothetical protein [Paraconexibacter algicola]|uniref:VCBS repeat-containing protein n=1 Tax=Paraconexibacter algicola TaxID=2133960 RepID=A0A2T4ULE5_9ACTN|nr:hypothetical protein [Paraconexibacter algicola]PTL60072.1 hypothetical protein C7Y72_10665 [Paraconexibacter algicola]
MGKGLGSAALGAAVVLLAAGDAAQAAAPPTFEVGASGFISPGTSATREPDVCVGDFDADGHLDVASASAFVISGAASVRVLVRYGTGTGALSAPVEALNVPTANSVRPTCATAQLTPGGAPELLLLVPNDANAYVATAAAGRTFTASSFPIGGFSAGIAAGDLDLDGDDDVVTLRVIPSGTGDGTDVLVPFENTGSGFVAGTARSTTLADPSRVELVDLGEDGRPDAVVSSQMSSAVVTHNALMTGVGFGAAVAAPGIGGLPGRNAVAVADVDADGRRDLLTSNGAVVRTSLGNGTGAFATPTSSVNPTVQSIVGTALATLDGDGDGAVDVVAGGPAATLGLDGSPFRGVTFIGKADPAARFQSFVSFTFGVTTNGTSGTEATQDLAQGDFDEDGRPDLVVATGGAAAADLPRIGILVNTTNVPSVRNVTAQAGSPTTATVRATVSGSTLAATAEVERVRPNGQVDVVAGSQQSLPAGSVAVPVEFPVAGLTAASTTSLRVVVRTTNGTVRSRSVTVTTPAEQAGGGGTTGTGGGPTSGSGTTTVTVEKLVPVPTPAAPGVLANRVAPKVKGRARVGQTLGCDVGVWTDGGRFSVRWLRGTTVIPKATSVVRKVTTADGGKQLRCRVTLRRADGATLTVRSAAVRVPKAAAKKRV